MVGGIFFTFIFCTVVIVKAVAVAVLKRQGPVTSVSPSPPALSLFYSAGSYPLNTSKATGSHLIHLALFSDQISQLCVETTVLGGNVKRFPTTR